LKDTLTVCSRDAELMIQEKLAEKKRYANKLLEFFVTANTAGDGILTLEEFQQLLTNPLMKTFLSTLELDAKESTQLFEMLDDGDGMIYPEEFVEGAMRLKGSARSQDVIAIMQNFKILRKELGEVSESLAKLRCGHGPGASRGEENEEGYHERLSRRPGSTRTARTTASALRISNWRDDAPSSMHLI